MVHGYHVIFGSYGFWLPNDPRGSWSSFVKSWELRQYGKATKTTQRRSLAHRSHNHEQRIAAKRALRFPAVEFNGIQARAVGRGFAKCVRKSRLVIWACAVLPDHAHLVIARHRLDVEQIVNLLKGEATKQLKAEDIHPLARYKRADGRTPKAWADGQWKVFLNDDAGIRRAIKYVENNPLKENKPCQSWSFVTPFVESLLHGTTTSFAR